MQTFIAMDLNIDDNYYCLIEVHKYGSVHEKIQEQHYERCKTLNSILPDHLKKHFVIPAEVYDPLYYDRSDSDPVELLDHIIPEVCLIYWTQISQEQWEAASDSYLIA